MSLNKKNLKNKKQDTKINFESEPEDAMKMFTTLTTSLRKSSDDTKFKIVNNLLTDLDEDNLESLGELLSECDDDALKVCNLFFEEVHGYIEKNSDTFSDNVDKLLDENLEVPSGEGWEFIQKFFDDLKKMSQKETISDIAAEVIKKKEVAKTEEEKFDLSILNNKTHLQNEQIKPVSNYGIKTFREICETIGDFYETNSFLDGRDLIKIRYRNTLAYFYYYHLYTPDGFSPSKKGGSPNKKGSSPPKKSGKKKNNSLSAAAAEESSNVVMEISSYHLLNATDRFFVLFDKLNIRKVLKFFEFIIVSMSEFKNSVSDKEDGVEQYANLNKAERMKIEESAITKFLNNDKAVSFIEMLIRGSLSIYSIIVDEKKININNGEKILGVGDVSVIVGVFLEDENIRSIMKRPNLISQREDYDKIQCTLRNGVFKPYWFQKEAVEYAENKVSHIVSGPTSGGKTMASILSLAKMIMKVIKNPTEILVYASPTDMLAFQTSANMIKSFPTISHLIGIITKTVVDINEGHRIIIGTPKELRDFFKIRDKFVLSKSSIVEESGRQKLENYVRTDNFNEINTLIIDEVHVMSRDYRNVENDKTSNAFEDLLSFLSKKNPHFIGLSATLPGESKSNLIKRVKDLSGISEIVDITYGVNDVGKYERDPYAAVEQLNNNRYDVNYDIVNNVINDEHSVGKLIEVNDKFIEALFFKIKLANDTPSEFFFSSETDAISSLREIISYINEKTSLSLWSDMKKKFFTSLEKSKNRDDLNNDYGKDEFMEEFAREIKSEINKLFGRKYIGNPIPTQIFEELFDQYTGFKFTIPNIINYSPDLYALIHELINYKMGKRIFTSPVHPFYNFGNIDKSYIDDIVNNSKNNKYVDMLESQNVNTKDVKTSSMSELIISGLQFGIGLVTSSIPVGYQIMVIELLKKQKGKNNLSFVFCDYQMSQGIDISGIRSVVIMNKELKSIEPSSFNQMAGRGGRTADTGKYTHTCTYTVNVSDLDSLNEENILKFSEDGTSTEYYRPEDIFGVTVSLIEMFNSINSENGIVNLDTSFSDSFFIEKLFPGIDLIPNKSDKYFHMAQEVRELFNIMKIASPGVAIEYLVPLFNYFQKATYENILTSSM